MNTQEIIILMLLIAFGTAYNLYRHYSQSRFEEELNETLKTRGYDAFVEMLEGRKGRRCYPRYTADLKKMDAAIHCERHEEARELILKLNQSAMSSRDYVNYNMAVLSYAVSRRDTAMGETACRALGRRGISQKYFREAEQVYDIYLLRKSNHIEELRAFAAKIKNPSSRAMAYYRIARQYYYMEDMEQCRTYLTMSKHVFPDRTWRSVIQNILDGDYSEMDS